MSLFKTIFGIDDEPQQPAPPPPPEPQPKKKKKFKPGMSFEFVLDSDDGKSATDRRIATAHTQEIRDLLVQLLAEAKATNERLKKISVVWLDDTSGEKK